MPAASVQTSSVHFGNFSTSLPFRDLDRLPDNMTATLSNADMHEVEELLGQAGNGSSAVISGLIASCMVSGGRQPAGQDTAAWQLFTHATAIGCDLNKSAQAALWQLQSGLCAAAHKSDR